MVGILGDAPSISVLQSHRNPLSGMMKYRWNLFMCLHLDVHFEIADMFVYSMHLNSISYEIINDCT